MMMIAVHEKGAPQGALVSLGGVRGKLVISFELCDCLYVVPSLQVCYAETNLKMLEDEGFGFLLWF